MNRDISELTFWLNRQLWAFISCGYSHAEATQKTLTLAKAQGRIQ